MLDGIKGKQERGERERERKRERGKGLEEEEGRGGKRKSAGLIYSSITKIHRGLYLTIHTVLPVELPLNLMQVHHEIFTGPLPLTRISHADYLVG